MAEETEKKNHPILVLILLHAILLLYSLSSVASKLASQETILSFPFLAWYFAVLALLVLYALGWQQVLKRAPLTVAFANKAITVVWGIIWGALIFNERITPHMIVGGLLIICGIILFVVGDNSSTEAAPNSQVKEHIIQIGDGSDG